MYTVQWAQSFTGFTKDNPIHLKDFAQFYSANIAGKHYTYTTNHKAVPTFTIESADSQLPHLMGLQHWKNLSTNQATKQFTYMFDGDWSLDTIKSADEGAWQSNRERIEFVGHLYNLLHTCNCTVKLVNPQMRASTYNQRNIDMLFERPGEKLSFALELRKIRNEDIYRPVSIKVIRQHDPVRKEHHHPLKITSIQVKVL